MIIYHGRDVDSIVSASVAVLLIGALFAGNWDSFSMGNCKGPAQHLCDSEAILQRMKGKSIC